MRDHWLVDMPIAHRGLHDETRPENSIAAAEAAIAAGFAIELDIQFSADGVPFVFHDDDLERLTGAVGLIRETMAVELDSITLSDGSNLPRLEAFLGFVAARTPLLVEVKTAPEVGARLPNLIEVLDAYRAAWAGPFAVQSFNPLVVRRLRKARPDWSLGQLSTYRDEVAESIVKRILVGEMALNWWTKPDFVAVDLPALSRRRAARLARRFGGRLLTWTVRSREEEEQARALSANIIFEGFTP